MFAFGNPIVEGESALEETCVEFWRWCEGEGEGVKVVWCCVDDQVRFLGPPAVVL